MSKRDRYVPDAFIRKLGRDLKGFKKISETHQHRLAMYIFYEGSPRRRHKHRKFSEWSTFGYRELERDFGRGGFNKINAMLNVFDVSSNWSKTKKETKAYKLTLQVANIRAIYLKPRQRPLIRLLSEDGRYIKTLPKPIDSKDTEGITAKAWRDAKLLNKLPIDMKVLQHIHAHLSGINLNKLSPDLFAMADGETLEYMTNTIERLLVLANTDVAGQGYLMHRYIESQSGRLYGKGLTLQTAPRIIRKAALHGLYEYDFENCHYAIFFQMSKRYEYECHAIQHYIANKNKVREGIAGRVGITKDDAKTCLLALMYGAKTTEWYENAIPMLIGQGSAAELYKDPEFSGIAKDINKGRACIIKGWPKRRTTMLNDMGKRIKTKDSPAKVLAHLIQGVEAKALSVAVKLHPNDVVLLMHDGFVTREPVNTTAIEGAVLLETGYTLDLAGERVEIPADLDLPKR